MYTLSIQIFDVITFYFNFLKTVYFINFCPLHRTYKVCQQAFTYVNMRAALLLCCISPFLLCMLIIICKWHIDVFILHVIHLACSMRDIINLVCKSLTKGYVTVKYELLFRCWRNPSRWQFWIWEMSLPCKPRHWGSPHKNALFICGPCSGDYSESRNVLF